MVWEVDPTHSSVRWSFTLWNGIITLTGPFRSWEAQLDLDDSDPIKGSVDATIVAPSFDVRDFRMHSRILSDVYLDAYKFPAIRFKSTEIKRKDEGRFEIVGDLTMRETTKQVALEAAYNGERTDEAGRLQRGYSGDIEIHWHDFLNGPPASRSDSTGGIARIHIEILAVKKS